VERWRWLIGATALVLVLAVIVWQPLPFLFYPKLPLRRSSAGALRPRPGVPPVPLPGRPWTTSADRIVAMIYWG